jgi:hypothetical protein
MFTTKLITLFLNAGFQQFQLYRRYINTAHLMNSVLTDIPFFHLSSILMHSSVSTHKDYETGHCWSLKTFLFPTVTVHAHGLAEKHSLHSLNIFTITTKLNPSISSAVNYWRIKITCSPDNTRPFKFFLYSLTIKQQEIFQSTCMEMYTWSFQFTCMHTCILITILICVHETMETCTKNFNLHTWNHKNVYLNPSIYTHATMEMCIQNFQFTSVEPWKLACKT